MPLHHHALSRFFFLPFLLIICLIGCEQTPEEPPIDNPTPPPTTEGLTYLALGDSYTIGESVATSDRWPAQLVDTLTRARVDIEAFRIIARTGWTTDELTTALVDSMPIGTFDMVSLLIGVNNQFRGYPFAQYEQEFIALVDSAVKYAGGDTSKVFVVSIPDYGVTPFGQTRDADKIAQELDQYNAYAQQVCEARSIPFFNITPISREALNDPTLVAADGLHPSGEMYQQWVELMVADVQKLIED
ncbi:MAG: SGNH/GDSL hydrolase family protein [Bacteroidota bacterium]